MVFNKDNFILYFVDLLCITTLNTLYINKNDIKDKLFKHCYYIITLLYILRSL